MSKEESSCGSCSSQSCSAKNKKDNENDKEFLERQELARRLCKIKHKLIVLSGKGGVGKTTVSANLSLALAARGMATGLLDVDIHGPSVPRIMGLDGRQVDVLDGELLPPTVSDGLKVMSIGFFLREREEAVIWRGPLKMGVIKQFLRDVNWGDLDYLVIDNPPGTGDEPLSVVQLMDGIDGAVIVTTPQDLATIDVRRSINFCGHVGLPVLGVVENMSGFVCPHCGETTDIFKSGGGETMAREMGVPYLGRIPIDPAVAQASDEGQPYITAFAESETAKAFAAVIDKLMAELEKKK